MTVFQELEMTEIKIVVFGAGGVGKSALTFQFVIKQFIDDYDPTIEDTYSKNLYVEGNPVKMSILDTAGQDDFSSMLPCYTRLASAFMLVYAIDDRSSFEEIECFHQDIFRTACDLDVPIVIVGNKCDLDYSREVTKVEGEYLAEKLHCGFFETSAKTVTNVDESFMSLLKAALDKMNGVNSQQQETVPVVSGSCHDSCCLLM